MGEHRLSDVGCVVIGRNEGERLVRCLRSVIARVSRVVYVDSGSTDGSPERARSMGAEVVHLENDQPFTAARARHVGVRALAPERHGIDLLQFVDGDCEMVDGFLEAARARLLSDERLAVVAGRRRERHPEASVFNRLCDMEWDTPVGEALACGGDSMMRADVYRRSGGFDPTIIAGEEPELCVRIRALGYRIERIDHDMTVHDADMHAFSAWWRRALRAGHAYAEGAQLHGRSKDRHYVEESRRILFWGLGVPTAALALSLPTLGASLALFAGYPLSAARVYRATRASGRNRREATERALFLTLGKAPELQGYLRYHRHRLLGRRSAIVEYKTRRPG